MAYVIQPYMKSIVVNINLMDIFELELVAIISALFAAIYSVVHLWHKVFFYSYCYFWLNILNQLQLCALHVKTKSNACDFRSYDLNFYLPSSMGVYHYINVIFPLACFFGRNFPLAFWFYNNYTQRLALQSHALLSEFQTRIRGQSLSSHAL